MGVEACVCIFYSKPVTNQSAFDSRCLRCLRTATSVKLDPTILNHGRSFFHIPEHGSNGSQVDTRKAILDSCFQCFECFQRLNHIVRIEAAGVIHVHMGETNRAFTIQQEGGGDG